MRRVRLSPENFDLARHIAVKRNTANEAKGLTDLRVMPDSLTPHVIGAKGEVAVCLARGLDPKGSLRTDRPDDGVDVRCRGMTLAVKTCSRRNLSLIVPAHQTIVADYIVLVWPCEREDEMDIVGTIDRITYLRTREWAARLPRPAWRVDWRDLKPARSA